MKKIFLICGIFCLVSNLFANNIQFSGELSTTWGLFAPGTENTPNLSVGNTTFSGTIDAYYGNSSLFFDGTIGFDLITKEYLYDINEAYLDYASSFWGIRLGRQKITWGKADGINITNQVFPENMTSLYNEDSALAIDGAKFSFYVKNFTIDGFWIPFFRPTELPLKENNPLRQKIVPSSVETNGFSIPVAIGNLQNPSLSLENGEYGLKISGYFSALDFSLYGFYGFEKTPSLNYTLNFENYMPSKITIDGNYNRLGMIGFDAAFPISEIVFRSEVAFFPQRHFQKSLESILQQPNDEEKNQTEKHNNLSALVGIDWMPSGWTFTAQYYFDIIFGDLENLQVKDAYSHGATLSIAKSFLSETLELNLSGTVGFNNFDCAIMPQVSYSLTDTLKASLGAFIFLAGPENVGTYGAYKDLSSIYIKVEYSF